MCKKITRKMRIPTAMHYDTEDSFVIPTKYHITIQKMIMQMNAMRFLQAQRKGTCPLQNKSLVCKSDNYSSTAACAAARRAMGTRKGEQLA